MSDKNGKHHSPKIIVTPGGKFNSLPEDEPIVMEEPSYGDMIMYMLLTTPSVKVINNMSRYNNDCFGEIEDDEEDELFAEEIEEISELRESFYIDEVDVLNLHVYDLPIDKESGINLLKGNIEAADRIYNLSETATMTTIDGDLHLHMIYLPDGGKHKHNHYKVFVSVILHCEKNFKKSIFDPLQDVLKEMNKLDRIYDVRIDELVKSEEDDSYMCLFSYKYIDNAIIKLV